MLVEAKTGVLRTVAAYIDLNSVRAGLVEDPKDYRFCGYAEAVVGHPTARKGLTRLVEGGRTHGWNWTQNAYRETLFGKGAASKQHGVKIDASAVQKVIKSRGKLPLHQVLRCRVRYFSDGAVLGGHAFVQEHLGTYQKLTGRRSRTAPRSIPSVTDWGDLATLRGLRRNAFG